jgi:uncharacterized membrane protein
MTEALLVIILIILIVSLSNINTRSRQIQESVFNLHEKINALKKELASKSFEKEKVVEQPVVKERTIVIEKPIIIEDKAQPEIINISTEKPFSEKPIEIVTKIETEPIAQKPIDSKPYIAQKSWFETFKEKNPDLEKFIGENLINKIGVLILVLGISFFVKFAIDKEWINEPARVGIGVLCGSLVMAIAHKLKKNYAAFSSVLVAGAISIFYFTISIAFHEYHLFSQTVAFIIMVVITAFSTLVSVSYNRQELAVLSLIGGFAAPFMISTGAGNYAVLFSYIAILDIGILGIAYFKKWKVVTILAFIFTSLLFASWYTKELFEDKLPHVGALAFATLFYFIFSITVVLSNIKNKGVFSLIEYFILVVNTFFFFGIGMGIMHNWGVDYKGLFTLLLAFYNIIYAFVLFKKFGLDKNAIYLLIGLALTFVTLTIPIQFEGNQITLFWAAEAVLLFWLSQKSKIERFKYGAIIVQGLTIISLLLDWAEYTYPIDTLAVILNPLFIAGIFVSASLFLTYWLLKKEHEVEIDIKVFKFTLSFYNNLVLLGAICIAYVTGFLEINYQAYQFLENTASALSFPVTYHFIFIAVLLFLASKLKRVKELNVLLIIAVFSIFIYIVSFYRIPNNEIIRNFANSTNTNFGFYLHYVVLACLAYFGFQLFKKANEIPKHEFLNKKFIPWLFVFATVYILSNEVMVHSLIFSAKAIDVKEMNAELAKSDFSDYSLQYEKEYYVSNKLDGIKRQIIKIGYPILWGVFSFIFLIIGIKKQWKNLRIIALSLLGLTIVKLFVYDIKNVSETGKIIAFILLGVLILIISFVYQKIKKLVTDETSKTNSDEEIH